MEDLFAPFKEIFHYIKKKTIFVGINKKKQNFINQNLLIMKKKLLKLFCTAFIAMLCIGLNAQDKACLTALKSNTAATADVCQNPTNFVPAPPSKAMWDIEFAFAASAGAHPAIATDGNNFYTGCWQSGGTFTRYNMDGSNPQTFTITGVPLVRSLTYDGTYFYAGNGTASPANSSIYKLDLANQTLIETITSAAGVARHLTYDPTLDGGNGGFWTGDWTTLSAISMTGAMLQSNVVALTSCYGTAYDGINHCIWLNTQTGPPNSSTPPSSKTMVKQFDLNTMSLTSVEYAAWQDEPTQDGIAGGAFVYHSADKVLLVINHQVSPNYVTVYEVGTLGGVPCPAVTNVTATLSGANKVIVSWTAPAGKALTNYKIYQGSTEAGTVAAGTTTWTSGVLTNGTYTFSVAAVYDDGCNPVKVAAAPIEIKTCDDKVSNVAVAYAADCSKATITWDAPAKGERGNIARGTRNYPSTSAGYIQFDCENILGATTISSMTAYGAGYLNGVLYNYRTESDPGTGAATNTFYQIVNPTTGAITSSTERTELYGVVVGSLCYDYTSNTMYAMRGATGSNKICTVNLETGQLTEIVTVSGDAAANMLLGMAIDLNGNMYAISAAPSAISNLFSINKTTGVSTLIGATGKAANYAQSISFDYNDANCPLYWAQISSTSDMNWMKLNLTTGAATIITANTGWEICGLYFPYTHGEPESPKYNVYRDGIKIAGPIEGTTFDDTTFDKTKPYTWSVAVVCSNGGDGEWVGVNKGACKSCASITNGAAAVVCETATITWTAVEGATGYKVSRGGTLLSTVTTPQYVENGEFEDGVSYTWEVITVCGEGEATPVNVTETAACGAVHEIGLQTFTIAPNPATGNEITIKAGVDFNTVEVVNFLGQTIISQPVSGNEVKLDVSYLNNGIYFVRIASEKGASVKKFIKQ